MVMVLIMVMVMLMLMVMVMVMLTVMSMVMLVCRTVIATVFSPYHLIAMPNPNLSTKLNPTRPNHDAAVRP